MKYFKSMYKKTKDFFYLMNYPQGIDADYDEECNKSFLKFLDYTYYFLVTCFSIFAVTSMYFFVEYAL